jgi:GMP synthase (glutamine-hydrolysing)
MHSPENYRTAVAIRHLAFEDLGTLEPVLNRHGYAVRYLDIGPDALDNLDDLRVDLLIVLGGPIGAFDDAHYPFLQKEVELIRSRLESGRPLLGICLGAQLMARAMGVTVKPMGKKEIGYAPVSLTESGKNSVLAPLAEAVPVFHWHGDQFDIPPGATNLSFTDICPHQAFAVSHSALGLQFHLEADAARIEQWLIGHAAELAAERMDPNLLRIQAQQHGAAIKTAAAAVFGTWLTKINASTTS